MSGGALVLMNAQAGGILQHGAETAETAVRTALADAGYDVEIRCLEPDEMEPAIADAARRTDLTVLVAGGGDGTLSMAASKLVGRGIALGCLPLGTMNLYCRSLGMPLDLREAARSLGVGRIESVDVGEVNGRTFLHHVSVGLQPTIVAQRNRENFRGRLGKMLATAKTAIRALRNPKTLDVTLEISGRRERHLAPALFVTSNPLLRRTSGLAQSRSARRLGIYICKSTRWDDLMQLGAAAMLTGPEANENLDVREESDVAIERNHRRSKGFQASIDGEIVRFDSPMRITCRRGALRLLVPNDAPNDAPK